jgi:dTDP-4-amino-4,6-dideoxygalactose transaminase
LAAALRAENIDSRKYYDPPVHRQTAYRKYFSGQPLHSTASLSANSLSLPIWSNMEDVVAERVCDAVRHIRDHAGAVHAGLARR